MALYQGMPGKELQQLHRLGMLPTAMKRGGAGQADQHQAGFVTKGTESLLGLRKRKYGAVRLFSPQSYLGFDQILVGPERGNWLERQGPRLGEKIVSPGYVAQAHMTRGGHEQISVQNMIIAGSGPQFPKGIQNRNRLARPDQV